MSAAQPIAIASTSKATANLAASPAGYGSLSHYTLAMSPALSFKAHTLLGSSIDMEHGSLIKSLRGQDAGFLSEDMCRDYTCCGLTLKDLHALVEHFEEAHVVVVDPVAQQPAAAAMDFSAGGFDLADDMDLDDPESMAPIASTSALPASGFAAQSVLVQRAAPMWNAAGTSGFAPYPRVRDALRRYQDYSTDAADCVVPELLFSPSVTPSPSGSRDGSPDPGARRNSSDSSGDDTPSTPTLGFTIPRERVFMTRAAGTVVACDLPARPKPFRCPKPGCNKAYKQANGLKYHLTHGQCNFAPMDPNSDELKPYICQASCGKRFKNMSGLRYHYLHSSHGQQGLELLDAGKHP